jgi:glycosyltransferase involved in cell wall biosynthesis
MFSVTAIVSTYNSERFMHDRLRNLVDQTLYGKNQLEIIVVDSGSSQGEKSIVEDFLNRYHHMIYVRTSSRETVYHAWNRGIRLASGDYVINANSDDRFSLDGLEVMASELDKNSRIHAVYGDWLVTEKENDTFDSNTRKTVCRYPDFSGPLLLHGQITSHAALIRKSVFEKIGFYDQNMKVYGDREFMLRFASRGFLAKKIAHLTGLYYENRAGLYHSEKGAGDAEFEQVMEKYLAPERFAGLFGRDTFENQVELARHYAYAGGLGRSVYWLDDLAVDNFGTAGKLFAESLNVDPVHLSALNNLGVISCLIGNKAQGMAFFDRAIKLGPEDIAAKISANGRIFQNGTPQFSDFYWIVPELSEYAIHIPSGNETTSGEMDSPGKPDEPSYETIRNLMNQNQYDEAIEALKKFLVNHPDSAVAHNDLGVFYTRLGLEEKALWHYENARVWNLKVSPSREILPIVILLKVVIWKRPLKFMWVFSPKTLRMWKR